MDIDYFTLDEENKYITNIKIFMEKRDQINLGKVGYLYLKMNSNNLMKIYDLLISISGKNFKLNDYTEEYKKSVIIK
jgi:hypothetical protein